MSEKGCLQKSLTPEQFQEVAERLELSIREDMLTHIQDVTGGKAMINALDLFELMGMVQILLAQTIRRKFPEGVE